MGALRRLKNLIRGVSRSRPPGRPNEPLFRHPGAKLKMSPSPPSIWRPWSPCLRLNDRGVSSIIYKRAAKLRTNIKSGAHLREQGMCPFKSGAKCNFGSQFARYGSIFLPEAPTQTHAFFLLKRGNGAPCTWMASISSCWFTSVSIFSLFVAPSFFFFSFFFFFLSFFIPFLFSFPLSFSVFSSFPFFFLPFLAPFYLPRGPGPSKPPSQDKPLLMSIPSR